MINALIVDDEILAAKALKLMIERYLPNNFDLEIQQIFIRLSTISILRIHRLFFWM
ncbi:MAG: hypothetical protein IPN46_02390 [Saprospiraceae bacterium]|nr:hypothetical protein [Saprospiraceae bacterium]